MSSVNKGAIEIEIKWCKDHLGESLMGSDWENGFVAGLRQASLLIQRTDSKGENCILTNKEIKTLQSAIDGLVSEKSDNEDVKYLISIHIKLSYMLRKH